jgi:hypothetical protein
VAHQSNRDGDDLAHATGAIDEATPRRHASRNCICRESGLGDQALHLRPTARKTRRTGLHEPPILLDRAGLPSNLGVAFEDEDVEGDSALVGEPARRPRCREAGDPSPDDDEARHDHTVRLKTGADSAACFSCW